MTKTLCPQEYQGLTMVVTPCTRCSNWGKEDKACNVYIGVEHLVRVRRSKVPACQIAGQCQHQIQSNPNPCPVRARGLICESVVGIDHPLAFNATMYE
jgi:hypothetical protein